MRILGIDPGTSLIGYGLVDYDKKKYSAVDYGVLRTASNINNADRVKTVFDFFDKLIKKYEPERVVLEKLFFFKNQKTVIAVSEIRGILLLAAAKNDITINEFTPLQVKQAVSGYGRAEKKQIQKMVQLILELKELPEPDDAADALALAICSANTVSY